MISRYHERSGNYIVRDTNFQLFGVKTQNCSTILPSRLGFLANQTALYGLDLNTILNKHTIYPFLTTFASTKNVNRVYQKLINNESGAFYCDLGLFSYTAKPKYLRYCPKCYQEELDIYGESYWHRFHQTPGIMICKKHNVLLADSTFPYDTKRNNNYITASNAIQNIENSTLFKISNNNLYNELNKLILFLYNKADYIRKIFESNSLSFSSLYIELLKEKDYATTNGSLRIKNLISAFQNYYGNNQLVSMGYSINDQNRPWIVSLCRSQKCTWEPIKHILMGSFLCGSFEVFINVAKKYINKDIKKDKIIYNQFPSQNKLESYRRRWLTAQKITPYKTRSSIIDQDHAAYIWLNRHDKQWLNDNSPPPQNRGGNKTYSNWSERDQLYTSRIPIIAKQLLKPSVNKPVKVTKTKLCNKIGINIKVISNGRLPKTEKALLECSETQDEFHRRKIQWAISESKRNDLPIVNWQILKKAGIRDNCWKDYYDYVQKLTIGNNYNLFL